MPIDKQLLTMNVLRKVIHPYKGFILEPSVEKEIKDKMRSRLREKALPVDEKLLSDFIRDYGSEKYPIEGANICRCCNQILSTVEVEPVQGYPEGAPVCAKCYVKYKIS
jgi:hypothetical protein